MSRIRAKLATFLSAFAVAFALLLAAAPRAHASPALEVTDTVATSGSIALPEPPAGYRRETRGDVRWVLPTRAESESAEIMREAPVSWDRIAGELGGDLDGRMEIRIALNPDDMKALAPAEAPPPEYATGVTYPSLGLILISLTAPETWERPDMSKLLAHEFSHLALHRAIGEAPIPRWFTEGLAVLQARENSIDRIKLLFEANVRDNLIPLRDLSRSFPTRPHAVNLAYAESASMVGFLQKGAKRARFPILLVRLKRGMPFGEAVFDSYDQTLSELERDWHSELSSYYTAIPLVLLGAIWTLVPILLVVGYVRKRRDQRKKLSRMAEEEAAVDRLERAIEERIRKARAAAEARALEAETSDEPTAQENAAQQIERKLDTFLVGVPAIDHDPDVPTIEHDGRNHILH